MFFFFTRIETESETETFVTERTELTVKPQNQVLEYGSEVIWECAATSDASTPVTIDWEYESNPVIYEPGRIEKTENNSLKLITGIVELCYN